MLAGEFDPDPNARMGGWLIGCSAVSLVVILLLICLMLVNP